MKWTIFLHVFLLEFGFAQSNVAFLKAPLAPSPVSVYKDADAILSPIEIVRGMAFVNARLEGQEGRFLLDTGAPLLVVNDKTNAEQKTIAAASLGTSFQIGSTRVKNFRWATVERNNLNAILLDINHLEKHSGFAISGIIGYDILKNFEVFFDYSNNQVILLQPGKNKLHIAAEPLATIPFELQDHLPVIVITIGDQTLRLGLDTGAGLNLLNQEFEIMLAEYFSENAVQEQVQAINQSTSLLKSGWMEGTEVGKIPIGKMKYAFADLSNLKANQGWQIDGVLGYHFFSRLKWSIDYPNRKVHIWSVLPL